MNVRLAAQVLHWETLLPHMFLLAKEPIRKGEELLLDYGEARLLAASAACPFVARHFETRSHSQAPTAASQLLGGE